MRTLSFADVERLRREAKQLKKEQGVRLGRALEEIAAANGWKNWNALLDAAKCGPHDEVVENRPLDKARYFVHGDEDDANPEQYYCEFCDRFEQRSHFESAHGDDAGRRTLVSLKTWRKLPIDAKPQYRRPNSAPNLFQHLYRTSLPAPQQKGERLRRSEPSGMFHAWLCEQEWRPDNVGEFARLAACDPNFPGSSDEAEVIRQHLRSAPAEALNGFQEAWDDFLEAVR